MLFSFEEAAIIKYYRMDSKIHLIEDLQTAERHTEDAIAKDTIAGVIQKLNATSDEDFYNEACKINAENSLQEVLASLLQAPDPDLS